MNDNVTEKVHIQSCKTCMHFDQEYPPPFCLICRTGKNDDYRKCDFYKENKAARRIEKAVNI